MALLAALALGGLGCGSSSSSKPADGGGSGGTGATGGADAGGGGGTVGTGGSGTTTDGGADAATRDATSPADGGLSAALSLGTACTTDLDCATGLVCLTASGNSFFDLGGPPHGYCSFSCATLSDQRCGSLGGQCSDVSNKGDGSAYVCLQSCTIGAAPDGKCRGRTDVGCAPSTADATSTAGVCTPTCSSTSECPSGRSCDFGICIPLSLGPPATEPVGKSCVPPAAGAMDPCTGTNTCISVTAASGSKSFCTRFCVIGSATACDFAGATTSLATSAHGICLGVITNNPNNGDLGFCLQQCDTATNCQDQVDTALVCDTSDTTLPHGICSWN